LLIVVDHHRALACGLPSPLFVESHHPYKLIYWSPLMRALALFMAFNLFMLPQVLTAQSIVNLYEECDSQPPPIIEEEVLKHACSIHRSAVPGKRGDGLVVLMHQYEERMLDHPVKEVPHQPPR
jgi:hypothetical protein